MTIKITDCATLQQALAQLCRFLDTQNVPKERVFDSKLAASELIGNVLRHSNGVAELRGKVEDGCIELIVASSVAFTPPQISRCADVYAEHGRGLFLVDQVCEERFLTPEGDICVRIRIQ